MNPQPDSLPGLPERLRTIAAVRRDLAACQLAEMKCLIEAADRIEKLERIVAALGGRVAVDGAVLAHVKGD